jgi:hypothetical protein
MSDLFETEEILSPRMKWIRAMGVRTESYYTGSKMVWVAWLLHEEDDFGMPDFDDIRCSDTESEAIDNLAEKLGVVNWEVAP